MTSTTGSSVATHDDFVQADGAVRRARKIRIPGSLASIVAEHLEREIIEGRVKPGERLTEEKWSAEFGISRGSFREVVRLLGNAGLVDVLPRRGARVGSISKKDVQEIYFLRRHLESLAAAKAAENASEEDLAEFRRIYSRMTQAAKRSDLPSYIASTTRFLDKFVEVAGNERLKMLLQHLAKPGARYQYLGLEAPNWIPISLKVHEAMLTAFSRHDSKRAARADVELLEAAERIVVAQLFGPSGDDHEGESKPGARSAHRVAAVAMGATVALPAPVGRPGLEFRAARHGLSPSRRLKTKE